MIEDDADQPPADAEVVPYVHNAVARIAPPLFSSHDSAPCGYHVELTPSQLVHLPFIECAHAFAAVLDRALASNPNLLDKSNQEAVVKWLVHDSVTQTLKTEVSHLSISSKKAKLMKQELAALCLIFDRSGAVHMMNQIVSDTRAASGKLLTFSEFATNDETPMRFRHQDQVSVKALSAMAAQVTLPGVLAKGVFEDALPIKVNHTLSSVILLVQRGSDFFAFQFDFVHWLQVLDSTRTGCYYNSTQQNRLSARNVANSCDRRQRVVCHDGDSALDAAERLIAHRERPMSSLRTKCLSHKAAGFMTKNQ
jgi:hypothetical protein